MIKCNIIYIIFLAFIVACNKPVENTLEINTNVSEYKGVPRKVLMIILDGAVGIEIAKVAPENIINLTDFAIYSWDALNSTENIPITNQHIWSNILTGVNLQKHKMSGNNFDEIDLKNYPSVFTRLKNAESGIKTAAFCSSNELLENLAKDATIKKSFSGNDAAVATAAKEELASSNIDFVLAQFHDLDVAGASGGYKATSTTYKNAIIAIDKYIAEMVNTIKKRPNYKEEDWMIILTSAKGSNEEGGENIFQNSRNNALFIYHNLRFKSRNPEKPSGLLPYIGQSGYFNGTQSKQQRAIASTNNTLYDIGSNGSYSFQCKVKVPSGNYYYPPFLSKRDRFTGGVVGWVMFFEASHWFVNFGQAGLGNIQTRGHIVCDNQWHTVTVVIKQDGNIRNVYTYTDGVEYPGGDIDIANRDNLSSPAPLTVGDLYYNSPSLTDYMVTDVRIYDTALDDAYIAINYCKTTINQSDKYFKNLLGYWPLNFITPGTKDSPDLSGNNNPLTFETLKSVNFEDISTNLCPTISQSTYRTVPNVVDASILVYQWLNMPIEDSWRLDGKAWIPTFNDLK